MRPFAYARARDLAEAERAGALTEQGQVDAPVQYLAGGTTLVDLMKLEVMTPATVVDITPLADRYSAIEVTPSGLRLGGLTKMSAAAGHAAILRDYPAIAQTLQFAASPQLRNMATLGGNVLQRTRCNYFRDPSWSACNKRTPGSGCAALKGANRNFAILGADDSCIAQYPGDFAIALAAFDAEVELSGPTGARVIPFEALHRPPDGQPHVETTLKPGEIITGFHVPAGPWTRRSRFVKVRDRQSYEFALASAVVGLDLDGDNVRSVRIGLGGMAYRPWRSREAESVLVGKPLTEQTAQAAAEVALAGAKTHGENAFKPELARRTIVRALLEAQRMEA